MRTAANRREQKTEWHRVVTFLDGLINMLERHAKKGRLVYVDGKLQTRRWSKPGEDGGRFSTEIATSANGEAAEAPAASNGNAGTDEFGSTAEVPF